MRALHLSMAAVLGAVALFPGRAAIAADSGRFVVLAPEVTSAEMRAAAKEMQDSGTLQEFAKSLNDIFVLPRNVGLRFAQCDEANAWYDTEAREISICLELLEGMAETLDGQFDTEDATADALAGAFIAVLLHEVGHALVDVLEIPVTGREEDAVDQLSAWMLIEADDVQSVLGAAASYYTDIEVGDAEYAGEHSLDRQRYYNLVCWAYGSAPDDSQELIDDWALPEDRAERCEDEYRLLDRSWTRLLQGHLRDGAATVATRPTQQPTRTPTAPVTAPVKVEAPLNAAGQRVLGRIVPGTMRPIGQKTGRYTATPRE